MKSSPVVGQRCRFLLAAATLALAGCGSSTGTVTGKVSYGEAMLKGGMITFYGADGRGFPTSIRDDGSYLLEQLPVGAMKVCVNTGALDPRQRKAYLYAPPPGKSKEPPSGGSPSPTPYVAIPPQYVDPTTTDVTCEVASGRQTFDIKLK